MAHRLIDLIDGDELAELLKKLKLGVHVKESISVEAPWFDSI